MPARISFEMFSISFVRPLYELASVVAVYLNVIISKVAAPGHCAVVALIEVNYYRDISLDKYLGADYPFYQNHYSESERKMMVRSMIVPDCLGFYLLSIYPMPSRETSNIMQRSAYMGRIQWVVNKAVGRKVFDSSFVIGAGKLMSGNKQMTVQQLLTTAPL